MATLTNTTTPAGTGNLRPFDVRHDLAAVADLVEQCFADTLDPQGEQYLRQMRSVAQNPGFTRWAAAAVEWASVPLSGYVWEEGGHLVGNANLIPYLVHGQRYFLIANVAVHPAYRRRGIARALTTESVEHARRRGAPSAWLHVRAENGGAVELYRSLGFLERARRSTWYREPALDPPQATPPHPGIQVVPRKSSDWPAQQKWLRRVYPSQLTWHLPINLRALGPGLLGFLYRFMTNMNARHWIAVQDRQPVGAITWQASSSYGDPLWLAPRQPGEVEVISALLFTAGSSLNPHRRLALDYPAGEGSDAIHAAGFALHQTLIWMEKPLR